jgi:hypothetical protein
VNVENASTEMLRIGFPGKFNGALSYWLPSGKYFPLDDQASVYVASTSVVFKPTPPPARYVTNVVTNVFSVPSGADVLICNSGNVAQFRLDTSLDSFSKGWQLGLVVLSLVLVLNLLRKGFSSFGRESDD